MITATTFTSKGIEGEKTNLPEKIFGVEASKQILVQAVRVYLSNQRVAHAKTKTRGEVTKTTAKMYKQKGTGRARHGAYSAPVFVGGGIAHGPTGTQNYKMTMPAKMAQLAILGALSEKAKNKKVFVISGMNTSGVKTKEAKELFNKLGDKMSTLLITTTEQTLAARSWRNLDKVTTINVLTLNAYEVLKAKRLVITPEVIKELTKKYVA